MVRAKKIITDYLSDNFDKNNLPLKLEYPFMFEVNGIKIGGRIDRIDKLDEGKIEVIDYKTGENVPTQQQLSKDRQLSFYALAASMLGSQPSEDKKPEDIVLSLVYLDKNIKVTTTRSTTDLEEQKEFILEKAKEITASEFLCSRSELCKTCEYKILCRV